MKDLDNTGMLPPDVPQTTSMVVRLAHPTASDLTVRVRSAVDEVVVPGNLAKGTALPASFFAGHKVQWEHQKASDLFVVDAEWLSVSGWLSCALGGLFVVVCCCLSLVVGRSSLFGVVACCSWWDVGCWSTEVVCGWW